jgi:hypothetical protein
MALNKKTSPIACPQFQQHNTNSFNKEQKKMKKTTLASIAQFRELSDHADCSDNRFAVVNEIHIDLSQFNDNYIVSYWDAYDCFNMSHADESIISDESFIYAEAYTEKKEATDAFVKFISDRAHAMQEL